MSAQGKSFVKGCIESGEQKDICRPRRTYDQITNNTELVPQDIKVQFINQQIGVFPRLPQVPSIQISLVSQAPR